MLDVIVRAYFIARLFAVINYATTGRRNFYVRLEENTKKHIQEDTRKKVLIIFTKETKRVERDAVA